MTPDSAVARCSCRDKRASYDASKFNNSHENSTAQEKAASSTGVIIHEHVRLAQLVTHVHMHT